MRGPEVVPHILVQQRRTAVHTIAMAGRHGWLLVRQRPSNERTDKWWDCAALTDSDRVALFTVFATTFDLLYYYGLLEIGQ